MLKCVTLSREGVGGEGSLCADLTRTSRSFAPHSPSLLRMTVLLFSPILHKLRAKVDLSTLARLLYSPECHPSRHRRAPTVTIKRGDSQVFGTHASSLMPQPQLDSVQH